MFESYICVSCLSQSQYGGGLLLLRRVHERVYTPAVSKCLIPSCISGCLIKGQCKKQ